MQYCSACLSSDRRVLALNDLRQIKPIIKLLNLNLDLNEDHICWECEAIFIKMIHFRMQIMQAQKIIKTYKNKIKKKIKPLSKLSITKKDSYDKIYAPKISDDTMVNEENSGGYKMEVDFIEDWDGFEDAGESNEQIKDEEENAVYIVENAEVYSKNGLGSDPESTTEAEPAMRLSKHEEQFEVTRMTLEEVMQTREQDRNAKVYKRCPFKCQKCLVGYYQAAKYERHVREKHEDSEGKKRPHRCSICDVSFTRRDALETHHDKHFRRYACRACAFAHHKLASMLAHAARAHASGAHVCDVCDKAFDRPRTLRYHKEQHKERPKCDICGKTASTKHNLKIHMMVHTGASRAQCASCGRWVRRSGLAAHARTHAPRDEGAYCAECGRQFASAPLYRRHLALSRAHATDDRRRFECTQCSSKFSDKYTLARHVAAKHLKMYPFKCHICNKGFIRKDRVQMHIMERHEGISRPKDKLCVYCGKGFKDGMSLKRHVRVHTGERPYACPHCAAAFAQSSTRNAHVRALHPRRPDRAHDHAG